MAISLNFAVVLVAALAGPARKNTFASIAESRADPTSPGGVDALVFERLKQLGIQPAGLCSDAVFVRRVYLDVIGTLPTAQEARQFLLDGIRINAVL